MCKKKKKKERKKERKKEWTEEKEQRKELNKALLHEVINKRYSSAEKDAIPGSANLIWNDLVVWEATSKLRQRILAWT